MANKFDINNKNKLDNPKRRESLPPYDILKTLGLQEGDIFADIGCGIGYFSIPAADIVGSKGHCLRNGHRIGNGRGNGKTGSGKWYGKYQAYRNG